jgi:hypothetical protein
MEDVAFRDEPTAYEHYRLIGDTPYLLVELAPDQDEVSLVVSMSGLDVDATIEGICSALYEILHALESAEVTEGA